MKVCAIGAMNLDSNNGACYDWMALLLCFSTRDFECYKKRQIPEQLDKMSTAVIKLFVTCIYFL